MQSRLISAIEAVANILIGCGVALASQYAIFPLFDIEITHGEHLQITAYFTAISFARSYFVRRWFTRSLNAFLKKRL